MLKKIKKIAEGKTKIIWATDDPDKVLIESKAVLTKGNGAERVALENKDIFSTETTSNCFILLNGLAIPTHFIKRVDERTFLAHRVKMIPIEIVIRRIATGSYLIRNPTVKEGTIFHKLAIEFFLKDDAIHDPLMIWNETRQCFELFDAKKPISQESYLGDLPKDTPLIPKNLAEVRQLSNLGRDVFSILEKAWEMQSVKLVDLKIECGYTNSGTLVVADVIDNDSWRIWPGGDKTQMKDKQVYRELVTVTPEHLEILKKNYAWVAEATKKFLTLLP
jgi:phosphoribosylaminoimidazole-succinocarboxamide synthase